MNYNSNTFDKSEIEINSIFQSVDFKKENNIDPKSFKTGYFLGEEREKYRISKELHDGLCQEFNILKTLIELYHLVNENTHKKEILNQITSTIDDLNEYVREYSFNLYPASLEVVELQTLLIQFFKRINTIRERYIVYVIESQIIFEPTVKRNLYRVIQEFVSNSIKHSKANGIIFKIKKRNNKVFFIIQDNGCGFSWEVVDKKNGNGVRNIIERLKYLNIQFSYKSKLNHGTKLIFFIDEK